jgi:hypothetical protein
MRIEDSLQEAKLILLVVPRVSEKAKVSLGPTRHISKQTQQLLVEINAVSLKAKEAFEQRFAKLAIKTQIASFQSQLIALHGMMTCVGQGQSRASRRKAIVEAIGFVFQFNRRLEILRKNLIGAELTEAHLTRVDCVERATCLKKAAVFSYNRKPNADTHFDVDTSNADPIEIEKLLSAALKNLDSGRFPILILRRINSCYREGKFKERYFFEAGEEPIVVTDALRHMPYFMPASIDASSAKTAKTLYAIASGLTEPVALGEASGRELAGLQVQPIFGLNTVI